MSIINKVETAFSKVKENITDSENGIANKARTFFAGDAAFFSATPDPAALRKQLDKDDLGTKKEAMKRILAQMSLGQDMSELFPDVVKNIHQQSVELRKLVYLFVVHYCDVRPNEALLSISAFQNDLIDRSMHVRALALRTLSSIRIAAINPVVLLAIKKASTDVSALVRKTAVIALTKSWQTTKGKDSIDAYTEILTTALGDKSMTVAGAAAHAFSVICPERHDLIHQHFRRLCRGLKESDEAGQVFICQMLLVYARLHFPDPSLKRGKASKIPMAAGESSDDETSSDDASDADSDVDAAMEADPDFRLLLDSVKPLLFSINRAVVLAAVQIYAHLAMPAELDLCVKPMLRLALGSASGHLFAYNIIYSLVLRRPNLWHRYVSDFYVLAGDNVEVRKLKIAIMTKLIRKENQMAVISEFRSYLRSRDPSKVIEAVRGLGVISHSLPEASATVLRQVTLLLSSPYDEVVTESVLVLRQLIAHTTDRIQKSKLVQRLARKAIKDSIVAAPARAKVVWLVGDNLQQPSIAKIAPDFFRHFVKNFTREANSVKLEVLWLGAKIFFNLEKTDCSDRFYKILLYLLQLVKYDGHYDLRDQGRLIETVIDRQNPAMYDELKKVVLATKLLPQNLDGAVIGSTFTIGTMSHTLNTHVPNHINLPEWTTDVPDSSIRNEAELVPSASESESESDASDNESDEDEKSDNTAETDSSAAETESEKEDDSDDDESSEDDNRVPVKKPAPKIIAIKKPIIKAKP